MKERRLMVYRGYLSSLAYYDDHPEMHDLARGEFSKRHSAVYRKLVRDGLIDLAIPEKLPTGKASLSEEMIQDVINSFLTTGNLSETARRMGCSINSVSKYVKRVGLETRKGGRPRKVSQ